ncbi:MULTISPECIES: cytochrome c family protein [unclassified Pseudomonas]|uniref:c-type cytochrome n=1 Tax=unclassified Pseudomonas TaxID=196821 RepID=UPI000B823957|nr:MULTISPECIES: c-type cytochrome [unclassified Pseudomonas]
MISISVHATAAPVAVRFEGRLGALLTIFLSISGLFFPIPASAQDADGARLFQQRCATCHSMEAGQNKAGPHLSGVIGRTAGNVEGATYSDAMRACGITWDSRTLDTFLTAPARMVRGTRMTVAIPNATQRAAIIQYLEGQSAN